MPAAAGREAPPAPPLDPAERARGRALAIASHPAAMTHHRVFTEDLPTLALVALGAGEAWVGLQRAFVPVAQLLQLPTLRAVGWTSKRRILIAGQLVALAGGLPLVCFGWLAGLERPLALAIALASLALTAVGIVIYTTVWFPLLRGYVEPGRVGRFFGTLRTVWHLTLIAYFALSQRWLAAHPGSFAPLFAAGWLCGLARIGPIARLPERHEGEGARVRVRDALALLRTHPDLRRYLLGVSLSGAARRAVIPFAIVMMRRVVGFSDAEVIATTIAFYAGGLASLYGFGRAVDRVGPAPIFRWTSLGMALLFAALLAVRGPGPGTLAFLLVFFFLLASLAAGFGVADTHLLFALAPAHAPAALLVVAEVASSLAYGLAPLVAGIALDRAIAAGVDPLTAYRGVFAAAALLAACAWLPLRGFRRGAAAPRHAS